MGEDEKEGKRMQLHVPSCSIYWTSQQITLVETINVVETQRGDKKEKTLTVLAPQNSNERDLCKLRAHVHLFPGRICLS